MAKNILVFDPATITGYASILNGKLTSGTIDCHRVKINKVLEPRGMIFVKFHGKITDIIGKKWDKVYYEQPHNRGGGATLILNTLCGLIESVCAYFGIECDSVHVGSARKAIIGRGNATKDETKRWFTGFMGREPKDDNEADAMCLLQYVLRRE